MTPNQRAKKAATILHSKIVRARGACEACGATQHLQCAHIVSRRYARTRTRTDNAFCLCAKCHMHFTEWPVDFAEFVEVKIGQHAYRLLRFDACSGVKVHWDIELARLKSVWAEIEAAV